MNRVDRLMAIVIYLQARRVARAEDLAEHFEISVRTVYRDMAALAEAGVPLLSEAGVGYALMKGYFLPPVSLTAEEASALVAAAMLLRQHSDASLDKHTSSAIMKVRSVLPRDRQTAFDDLERTMAPLDCSARSYTVDLADLQAALCRRSVLRISYEAPGRLEATEREIEPLGLVFYLERWHLIAWCRLRRDYRDFRADRIIRTSAGTETFEPHAGFSLREFLAKSFQPENPQIASIRFSRAAVDRARREWGFAIRAQQEEGDNLVLTFAVAELRWITGWLLSFGREAEVISPPELREMIVAAALDAAAHHTRSSAAVVS